MTRCFLSLGSNSGNRAANLREALRRLSRLPRTRLVRSSSVYEASPVGVRGQRNYLNAAAELRTSLSPLGLLVELKRLEAGLGRKPGSRWAPRPVDLDILFYGRLRLDSGLLRIPHPRALRRRFVLLPLAELAPLWRPPGGGGRTILDRLARLKAPSQNVRLLEESLRRRANP